MIFSEQAYFWGLLAGPFALLIGWRGIRCSAVGLARFSAMARYRAGRSWLALLTEAGALCLIFFALAGPELPADSSKNKGERPDVIVLLDVSASMGAEDVPPSRAARARREIKDLVGRMPDGRIGLVRFAGEASLACPLAGDHDLFLQALDREGILLGGGTSLGAGLLAALDGFGSAFEETAKENRSIVVVTDGEERGNISLFDSAVAQARKRKIPLFGLLVGTPDGAGIPLPRGRGYMKDKDGIEVTTYGRADLLERAADATGGICTGVASAPFPMDHIFQKGVIPAGGAGGSLFSAGDDRSLFQVFLLAALFLYFGGAFISLAGLFVPKKGAPAMPLFLVVLPVLFLGSCGEGAALETAREGNRLFLGGDFRGARRAYEESCGRLSSPGPVLVNLGLALYKLGEYDSALARFRRAMETGESGPTGTARFGSGLCLYKLAESLAGSGERALVEAALEHARGAAGFFEACRRDSFYPAQAAANKLLALELAREIENKLEERSARTDKGHAAADERSGEAGRVDGSEEERGTPASGETRPGWGEDPGPLTPEGMTRLFALLDDLRKARREKEKTADRKPSEIDW